MQIPQKCVTQVYLSGTGLQRKNEFVILLKQDGSVGKNLTTKTELLNSGFKTKIHLLILISSFIDSGTNFNFLLHAQVICHLHDKYLLSPKITVNAFHTVLLSSVMTQFTLKLSEHLLFVSSRKFLNIKQLNSQNENFQVK